MKGIILFNLSHKIHHLKIWNKIYKIPKPSKPKLPNKTNTESTLPKNATIEHSIDSIPDQKEIILTLKDSNILDGDELAENDDVLVNVDIVDAEKTMENIQNRTRKIGSGVNSYEDLESDSVLRKYDEVIDGKAKKSFSLDNVPRNDVTEFDIEMKMGSNLMSLDYIQNEASDFLTEQEIVILLRYQKAQLLYLESGLSSVVQRT